MIVIKKVQTFLSLSAYQEINEENTYFDAIF